jgi:hypothetical protein
VIYGRRQGIENDCRDFGLNSWKTGVAKLERGKDAPEWVSWQMKSF